jgi:DNA mismatch repair ATPase MutS
MSLIEALRNFARSAGRRIGQCYRSATRRIPSAADRRWTLSAEETAAYLRTEAPDCLQEDFVDDRTWSDLEMEKIYARFDRCITPMGAQYLYALLRTYQTNPESLKANVQICHAFKTNPQATVAVQCALRELGRQESANLAEILLGAPAASPEPRQLFYLISAASVACPLGLIVSPWFLLPCLSLWVANIFLHYFYGKEVLRHSPALTSLAILLNCVPQVSHALDGLGAPEREELQKLTGIAKRTQKQVSRVFLGKNEINDLVIVVIEYLNVLCLFELCAMSRAIVAVNRDRSALIKIFRIVARLDAMQGISSALAEYPLTCVPELKAGRSFMIVDVYHPLLNNPVCNTIEGTGQSLLLSGTNMAGKTTFIKTLALNLLLSQSIGQCLARKAVLPPARVRTLIEREDKITSGQSYFFFEASELLRMLNDGQRSGREHWFVLDEIFRGTNAVERVAAGRAVLSYLARHGVVIASTHDHELTNLLREEFDMYHFSEVIDGNEARFDYLLQKGPCTTRNAIRLLVLAGYPKEVTDLAGKLTTPANLDGMSAGDRTLRTKEAGASPCI